MSDWTELKRVSLAVAEGSSLQGLDAEEAMHAFECAATPDVVLALIAENERLASCEKAYAEVWGKARGLQSEMDLVLAENKLLRRSVGTHYTPPRALLAGQFKCLACGEHHYGMGGLPCPNMRVTAQADLPDTRSGQIGAPMGKREQS